MTFLKNNKVKAIVLIISSIVAGVVLLLLGLKIKNSMFDFNIPNSKKEVGELCKLKVKKYGVNQNLKYPYFKDNALFSTTYHAIEQEVKDFSMKNSKQGIKHASFYSDYESFSFNEGKGVSLCYHFLEKNKHEKKQKVKTLCFFNNNQLNIKHIFKPDSMKKVIMEIKNTIRSNKNWSNIIKNESINLDEKIPNTIDSLKNFAIKDDSVEFYFNSADVLPNKYGVLAVNIANNRLKDTFAATFFQINKKEAKLQNKNLENSKKPLIALTFDDGPGKETTNKILDALEKYDARATFFVVGKQAKQFPEILKREISNGHEIANHTYSHSTLTKLGQKNIEAEIFKTDRIIEKATGKSPQLVRAPGGSVNTKVKEFVKKPLIYWSIDTKDWKTKNSQKTIDAVLKNAADGDIVLMHDIVKSTSDAAEKIISGLINRGFSLVTVSEMFNLKDIPLEQGKQYIKARK